MCPFLLQVFAIEVELAPKTCLRALPLDVPICAQTGFLASPMALEHRRIRAKVAHERKGACVLSAHGC